MKEFRSLEHIIRDIVEGNENRNTEIRRKVANVGRPDDNVKDETSKLAKQGEIKTKIVDEGLNPEDVTKTEPKAEVDDKDDKKKKKSDGGKDDVDAGEMKGGKTEVILDPKTNDIYHPGPDSTGAENDAKKTKKEAMKKAGVKEEAMLKSDNTFGLPADLIATVAEALKGGQKKIDANHNGKVDGQDFKILRGETKVKAKPQHDKARPAFTAKEEAEQVEEEQLDELSNKTLYSYGHKAHNQVVRTNAIGLAKRTGGVGVKNAALKLKNRKAGVELAHKKAQAQSGFKANEEVEFSAEELARLEEISKSFLEESFDEATKKSEPMATTIVSSPLRGPKQDYSGVNDKNNNADYTISDDKKLKEDASGQMDQMKKQMQAKKDQIQKQIMAKKMAVMQAKASKQIAKIKEEQIDELSKETLKSYVKKVDKRGEGVKRGTGLNTASQKIAKQEPTSTLKKTVDAIKKTPHGKMKSSSVYKFGASHAELQRRGVKEEAEHIEELSNATLSSYKDKAAGSEKAMTDKSSSLSVPAKERNAAAIKANQRRQGMKLATSKMKEEVEQIDEMPSQHRSAAGSGKNTNPNLSKLARKLSMEKPRSFRAPGTPSKAENRAELQKLAAGKEVTKLPPGKAKGIKEESLEEAQRGRPKKNPTAEDPGSENIIMQLRKVITLRGQEPVKFADGRSVKLSPAAAHSALAKYDNLRTSGEKHAFSMRLHKSMDSMRDAIMGKAEPSKPKISLAGKITGTQKEE